MSLRRNRFFEVIHTFLMRYVLHKKKSGYGQMGEGSFIHTPSISGYGQKNIYFGDHVNIDWNSILYCDAGKFIMKDYSGASVGFTVVTSNHVTLPGETIKDKGNGNLVGKDVIVEEDVWIAANVTLLAGSYIGRGAIVGAGSVVAGKKIPPYAIVMGNPCKVVGFRFTPTEVIDHELKRYKEEERLPIELLESNYKKYFLSRRQEIKKFMSIQL